MSARTPYANYAQAARDALQLAEDLVPTGMITNPQVAP